MVRRLRIAEEISFHRRTAYAGGEIEFIRNAASRAASERSFLEEGGTIVSIWEENYRLPLPLASHLNRVYPDCFLNFFMD